MSGLLSYASPWQGNPGGGNAATKKRIPSMPLPKNKTIKKQIQPMSSNLNSNDLSMEDYQKEEDTIFQVKENFETELSPASLENVQKNNLDRSNRVYDIINKMSSSDNDGQSLANFKPIEIPQLPNTVRPSASAYSTEDTPLGKKYDSYHDVYSNESRMGEVSYLMSNQKAANYSANHGSSNSSDGWNHKIMEKLNKLMHMMEEQQLEPTQHIMEEFILYTFLGVFVIYIVDSFARAGKYIR